jgi:cobalt-zinc-cadmium efflux system membrane fusion protein
MRCSIALRYAALGALLILRCLAARAQTPGRSSDAAPAASGATVIVGAQSVTETFRAYARIEPLAITKVHAVEPGVVRRLVLPGERVTVGQVLAVLGGAQAESLLAERRGALRAASVQLAADRRKLTARLVTRQTVAADAAAYAAARGRLQVALETLTLRAPAAGQVLAVAAADGEQVAAGQLILSLQTSRPWLQASYYGSDALAIRPGMTGRFQPISGAAIPVRVRTVSQALQSDGGEWVGLFPLWPRGHDAGSAPVARWRSGEWGTVTVDGKTRKMVAVPTRALIFDRARWWVLVRTPRGDRRQVVVPGPTRGWMTFVSRGLKPGERIVVRNADLEFHRGISRRYIPPD